MRDAVARLGDILESIAAIRRHAGRGRGAFEADELVQVWIIHHLQIIGKAAARLDPGLRATSSAPWAGIVGMRNILVHRYFGIDRDAVWAVVEHDLEPLEVEVRRLLAELGPPS
ncbi:MAG TPA: HepT-like ribonuclease domain-containing protein [Geminicoccaceae bacterium]|nr:HepT-like ribonuclease domain-containing protein [Geminicoccaceae bacterium]